MWAEHELHFQIKISVDRVVRAKVMVGQIFPPLAARICRFGVVAPCQRKPRLHAVYVPPKRWRSRTFTKRLQSLLHAIPGAGKSFCTRKVIAFFEAVMRWTRGVHFRICTLQMKLAAELGGTGKLVAIAAWEAGGALCSGARPKNPLPNPPALGGQLGRPTPPAPVPKIQRPP